MVDQLEQFVSLITQLNELDIYNSFPSSNWFDFKCLGMCIKNCLGLSVQLRFSNHACGQWVTST